MNVIPLKIILVSIELIYLPPFLNSKHANPGGR